MPELRKSEHSSALSVRVAEASATSSSVPLVPLSSQELQVSATALQLGGTAQVAVQTRRPGVPQAVVHGRTWPGEHGKLSSTRPSQSSSMPLQFIEGPSAMPGRMLALPSSQSPPHAAPLQQADEPTASTSASTKPSVASSQSSSSRSQTSVAPG